MKKKVEVLKKWLSSFPFAFLIIRLLATLTALRFLFGLYNFSYYFNSGFGLTDFIKAVFFGIRLDLIPVYSIGCVLWLLWIVKPANRIFRFVLALSIFVFTLITAVDAAYFRFSKERIGLDIRNLLASDNNISLFQYVKDYWHLALLVVIFSGLSYRWLSKSFNHKKELQRRVLPNLILLVSVFIIARGGLRRRPIRSADAANYVSGSWVSFSLNPALLVAESWSQFSSSLVDQVHEQQPEIRHFGRTDFQPVNFIFIIAESFGKEYTVLNHNYCVNYTPRLNALMDSSLVFTNAYANGLKSMDAVPALFSGIPRLESEAFINSPKSINAYGSIFSMLKDLSYTSSFFHGANNSTMGFQSYLKSQGLDSYFGINEYPKDRFAYDFDGNWGIYDLPWLLFSESVIDKQKEPFVSAVFTLSSHHPYPIPDAYKNRFDKGNLKIHESIGYTDFAIDSFINACKKEEWFKRTVFVITADHSSENAMHAFRTPSGKYEIPVLFYAPGIIEAAKNNRTLSQIDIVPTLLDLLGIPVTYSGLGHSVLNSDSKDLVVHFDNGVYHITEQNWNFGMTAERNVFLYDKEKDPNCLENVLKDYPGKADSMRSDLLLFTSRYKGLLNR